MFLSYFLMAFLVIIIFCVAFIYRRKYAVIKKIGFISWISLIIYFIIEYFVIRATTTPYDYLVQPMSDLGVTTCGSETYVLATYEICSPYHLLMNWTFTFTGIVIFVGALFLHQCWNDSKLTRVATALLVTYGISYTTSGIVPADISFLWHTLLALPGMFVQIPALLIIGRSMRIRMPKLSLWTFTCALINISILILLFLQPFIGLPGGLLQRMLYGSVYLWMIITAIMLWKSSK